MVTQKTLRTHEEKWVFFEGKKIRFMTALVLSKILKQIKYHNILLFPGLPSNISTMNGFS